ncbi:MAG: protein-L-isoaspartate(D-aspartate) O-methyltransferase [Albidovulum sp.]|nr:protein-L-isoaspartate(D-aspartate) O-methyltransferase [Albidovulum sp.]
MNSVEARQKLEVEVRRNGVTCSRVLKAMREIDRRDFVPATFASRAYLDIPLPIPCGQTISQPTIVGIMTQALDIDRSHRVLEIGTGSGYQAAILSKLAKRVFTLERHPRLHETAREMIIGRLKQENVALALADGMMGLPEAAPFDRIIVTAAHDDIPDSLLSQLADGGILVMPVESANNEQQLVKAVKTGKEIEYTDLCGVRFVPLLEGIAQE